jgi:hypothetical protein
MGYDNDRREAPRKKRCEYDGAARLVIYNNINVKRMDCFDDYIIKNSDKFRLLLLSNEYKKLSSSYSSRFPRVLSSIVRS